MRPDDFGGSLNPLELLPSSYGALTMPMMDKATVLISE
jgi:hypothetical protein